jgi:hypothetical protein
MSRKRTSPYLLSRLFRRYIFLPLWHRDPVNKEIDELLLNAGELEEDSDRLFPKLDRVMDYWNEAIKAGNWWAIDLARKVHYALLDQVESNNRYHKIAVDRAMELLDQKSSQSGSPPLN